MTDLRQQLRDVEEELRQLDLRDAPRSEYREVRDRRDAIMLALNGDKLRRLHESIERSVDASDPEEA